MLIEQQITERRERAARAIAKILKRPTGAPYGDYSVKSASGKTYLRKLAFSCLTSGPTFIANKETGTIFPVAQLAAMAHDFGALFHTDAVQAFGKIPLHLKDTAVDMASLSAHKLHGPKGVGALY